MCRSRAKCYPVFRFFCALVANFSILQALRLHKYTQTNRLITLLLWHIYLVIVRLFFSITNLTSQAKQGDTTYVTAPSILFFLFLRSPCNHRVGDRPYQMNLNFFSSEADQPKKRFFSTLLLRNPPQFWFFLSLFPRLDTNYHKNTQVMVWLTVCCFRSTFRIPKMHR